MRVRGCSKTRECNQFSVIEKAKNEFRRSTFFRCFDHCSQKRFFSCWWKKHRWRMTWTVAALHNQNQHWVKTVQSVRRWSYHCRIDQSDACNRAEADQRGVWRTGRTDAHHRTEADRQSSERCCGVEGFSQSSPPVRYPKNESYPRNVGVYAHCQNPRCHLPMACVAHDPATTGGGGGHLFTYGCGAGGAGALPPVTDFESRFIEHDVVLR